MFGWVEKIANRIAQGLYQRGQSLTETADRAMDERRAAIRSVRDAITEAMTHAERDRDHGNDRERDEAVAAMHRATAVATEVEDEEARQLVSSWRALFDAIPKGWKESHTDWSETMQFAPGYPQPAWDELKTSAQRAQDQLGADLRELLERPK
jgi:uncharacterized membrane protein YccC